MIGHVVSYHEILSKRGEGGGRLVCKAVEQKLIHIVALNYLPPGPDVREPTSICCVQQARTATNQLNPCVVVRLQPWSAVLRHKCSTRHSWPAEAELNFSRPAKLHTADLLHRDHILETSIYERRVETGDSAPASRSVV